MTNPKTIHPLLNVPLSLSGPIRKFFDAPYRSCKTEEDKDFAGNLIAHTRESINEIELRTTKSVATCESLPPAVPMRSLLEPAGFFLEAPVAVLYYPRPDVILMTFLETGPLLLEARLLAAATCLALFALSL